MRILMENTMKKCKLNLLNCEAKRLENNILIPELLILKRNEMESYDWDWEDDEDIPDYEEDDSFEIP